jgi:hypothetical protein
MLEGGKEIENEETMGRSRMKEFRRIREDEMRGGDE